MEVYMHHAFILALTATALSFVHQPPDIVGEWRYTTVDGKSYWDGSTGKYLGHGGGNSETYVFAKDGTFKDYVYIENSPTAGWTTQIYTTLEGKYEISGDTLKLTPTKGNYKVRDNRVKRYNYDRPMTEEETKKMAKSYRFTLAKEDGKPALVIHLDKSELKFRRP
jgi:hypothetical protein